jgi:hypothetical protein
VLRLDLVTLARSRLFKEKIVAVYMEASAPRALNIGTIGTVIAQRKPESRQRMAMPV